MFSPWPLPAAFIVDEAGEVKRITHTVAIPGEALVALSDASGETWIEPISTVLDCTIFPSEETARNFAKVMTLSAEAAE